MEHFKTLIRECQAELSAIGISYGTVTSWKINTRAKSRWGQCRRLPDGSFEIQISHRLLTGEIDPTAAKKTIIHELLHTVRGCQDHQKRWKLLADRVNKAYPAYHIKRTSSYQEKGLSEPDTIHQKHYCITCQNCGMRSFRQRASRVVTHPEHYRCFKCGGSLLITKIDLPS